MIFISDVNALVWSTSSLQGEGGGGQIERRTTPWRMEATLHMQFHLLEDLGFRVKGLGVKSLGFRVWV